MAVTLWDVSGSVRAQMSADEQLKKLRVPDGAELSLFAAEPLITNPAAIDIDTHGRVWVAEIQWYRARAKQPPADKIKVLEDTDGDGKADKVTVFADGVFAPMSICVAGTKVYVATSPDLWVYEDKDGDLRADGPPTKLLTGFGGFNHDHGAHSLVLGPDHKWWMSHGDTGFNVKGVDGSHIEFRWGAMLRGELDGSKLETVAVNFRNPYEIAVSSFGESFCSDNDNDGNESVRVCWILEGGNYGWFGGPPGPKGHVPAGTPFGEHWHFRGHVPGFVPATLVTGFGSPCGMCFYEGDAFGPKLKNAPLHCDAGPREVRIYRHELAGYGMKATSENLVTSAGDNYFRPDDICAAPDGSLYISDWYDGGVGGHAYNDPDRGRIFVLRPKGKKLARVGKPGPFGSVADAIEGLKSPNLATQFLARERLLAEGQASVQSLKRLLTDAEPNYRARALWVLDRIGGAARNEVVEQLRSSDSAFRALAVRILRRHGAEYFEQLNPLAGDSSLDVRREVLLALPDLLRENNTALQMLARLASSYDGRDRYQLEAINAVAADVKPQLFALLDKAGVFTPERFALMQVLDPKAAGQYLVARLSKADLDEVAGQSLLEAAAVTQSVEAGQAVATLAGNAQAKPVLRRLALQKLDGNLFALWKPLAGDARLISTVKQLLSEKALQLAALDLAAKHGLTAVGGDVLQIAKSANTDVSTRQRAIVVAAQLKPAGVSDSLRSLLADQDAVIRQAALAALVDMQDVPTLRDVLAGDKSPPEVQRQMAERLMASSGGALVLLRMIDAGTTAAAVRDQAIAKAASHPDSNVRVLYEKFIPTDQRPKRLGEAIKPEEILALKGDAKRGEQIFFQSSAAQCKNCHVVHGKGSTVGPDLSNIGKKYERKTLLETILEPSKAIAPEFIAYLVETKRGIVYAGFVMERTDQHLVIKDSQNQLIKVPAADVGEVVKQEKSLMPELVLRDVTAQDAADLLAFLESLTGGAQSVNSFRIIGPFPNNRRELDRSFGPEKKPGSLDFDAEHQVAGGRKLRWELVAADSSAGFAAVDTVKFDAARGAATGNVTHYFAVFIDSAADQDVTLLVGSDDGCKLWMNGQETHTNDVTRAVGFGQDRVRTTLKTGRNTLLIKVVNGDGPGGLSLAAIASGPVQFKTE
jgi:putative membrane-bound dehydrogenase-like protein